MVGSLVPRWRLKRKRKKKKEDRMPTIVCDIEERLSDSRECYKIRNSILEMASGLQKLSKSF